MSKTLAVNTLTSLINASVNRDQTGEAKKCVIGNVIRGRISSQCLKYHWRESELFSKLDNSAGSQHYRTRHGFKMIAEDLKAENLPNAELIPEYTALALRTIAPPEKDKNPKETASAEIGEIETETEESLAITENETELEATAVKSKKASTKKGSPKKGSPKKEDSPKKEVHVLSSTNLISISKAEIDVIKATIRTALQTKDVSVIEQLKLKGLSYELPPSIALAGKFNTAKALSTVDGSWNVAHSFSIHQNVSDADYYIATDDLAKNESIEKPSGAAYLASSNFNTSISINIAKTEDSVKIWQLLVKPHPKKHL